MANELMKIMVFLITMHTLVFFAGQSVILQQGKQASEHKTFVDQFLTGQFTDTVEISDETGIISGTIRLAAKTLDFIGLLAGITVSPFLLFVNSPLPQELALLFGSLVSFLEISAIAYFIRGIG